MRFIRDLLGNKNGADADPQSEPFDALDQSFDDTIGSVIEKAGAQKTPAKTPAPKGSAVPRRVVKRAVEDAAVAEPDVDDPQEDAPEPEKTAVEVKRVIATRTSKPLTRRSTPQSTPAPSVNIWDLEDDDDDDDDTPPLSRPRVASSPRQSPEPRVASAAAARSPARSRRTKTRLIGFEKSNGDVVDLFNDAPAAAPAKGVKFPVGWIVVTEGHGRGESFPLQSGMSQIGRGEDQAIQLDFGDTTISRSNHAAIVYDVDNKEFLLGHGGKSNIVRLNNKPVISNEAIKTGDMIRIGETVLRFVALCDQSFNWSDGATGKGSDVAIA